jgi:pimeloyl-ACP methyl ester carboxylesterase
VERRIVDLGGDVHYDDYGGEGRTIVLVHGLGGNALNWMAAAPLLAREARVVALDLLGHGRTVCWDDRTAGIEHNRELIARFVEEIVPGGRAVLAGNSMGGLLSMLVAGDRPDLVEGLVLVDAVVPLWLGETDPVVAQIFNAYYTPGAGEALMKTSLDLVGPEGLVMQTLTLCSRDFSTIPPEVVQAHVREAVERRSRSPRAIEDFLTAARTMRDIQFDVDAWRAAMQAVAAPTLVVHGAHDRLIPVEGARGLAALRPDWRLEVMEDSGHIPMMEEPEEFSRIVLGWLATLPATTSTSSSTPPSSPTSPSTTTSTSTTTSPSTTTSTASEPGLAAAG